MGRVGLKMEEKGGGEGRGVRKGGREERWSPPLQLFEVCPLLPSIPSLSPLLLPSPSPPPSPSCSKVEPFPLV